jgi:hypothetical protein
MSGPDLTIWHRTVGSAFMLTKGKTGPVVKKFRALRAWAGVRPLYHETK